MNSSSLPFLLHALPISLSLTSSRVHTSYVKWNDGLLDFSCSDKEQSWFVEYYTQRFDAVYSDRSSPVADTSLFIANINCSPIGSQGSIRDLYLNKVFTHGSLLLLAWIALSPWRWREYVLANLPGNFYRTTRRHIPENSTHHIQRWENLKSNWDQAVRFSIPAYVTAKRGDRGGFTSSERHEFCNVWIMLADHSGRAV
jgi:hypothetical protein